MASALLAREPRRGQRQLGGALTHATGWYAREATISDIERSTIAALRRRLLPFLFVLFVVNFLDRVNVGFAALRMNAELGFTPEVFGFGVGLFFVAYLLFEIPSNIVLQKVGARFWIARIMVTWGAVSTATAFVSGTASFYVLRFLLGLAEAGFVPGILLYLSTWFPAQARAGAIARFMMASAISLVIGAPLSGALLSIGTVFGMSGWQWMFVLEGVPSILLGIVAFRYLTDRPQDAAWLTDEQRAWLVATLHREVAKRAEEKVVSLGAAFRHPGLWTIGGVYFCIGLSFYGVSFWLPQIIRQLSGLSPLAIGLLTAVPFVGAAAAMVLNGRHSDRTGERRWHIAVSCFFGALGFVIGAAAPSPTIAFLGLCIGAAGIWGSIGVFWSLPMEFLGGTAAAGGIALVNSLGNIGGFAGPYLIGWLRTHSADFGTALLLIAAVLVAGSLMVLTLRQRRNLPAIQGTV